MTRTHTRSTAIAAGTASLLLLSAGAPAYAAAEGPGPVVRECGELSAEEAVETWGPELDPYTVPGSDLVYEPLLEHAVTEGYDACADLSWIVVAYGGTASSPNAVMLFHGGEYLGTDTAEPQGFVPRIDRIADGRISITYSYLLDDEANAAPEGRAFSTFTWDETSRSVLHDGEFPPEA